MRQRIQLLAKILILSCVVALATVHANPQVLGAGEAAVIGGAVGDKCQGSNWNDCATPACGTLPTSCVTANFGEGCCVDTSEYYCEATAECGFQLSPSHCDSDG